LDEADACGRLALYYPQMGAYTLVAASNFNGFDKPEVHYVVEEGSNFDGAVMQNDLGCHCCYLLTDHSLITLT